MLVEKYKITGLNDRPPTEVTLKISSPKDCEHGYEVFVELTPLFDKLGPFRGETGFNALQLATRFVSRLMSGYNDRGVQIQITGLLGQPIDAIFLKM